MAKKATKSEEERAQDLDDAIRRAEEKLHSLYSERAHRRGTGYIKGWIYCGCGRTHIPPIAPCDAHLAGDQTARDRLYCEECKRNANV